jgi:hypothetical protein
MNGVATRPLTVNEEGEAVEERSHLSSSKVRPAVIVSTSYPFCGGNSHAFDG